MGGNIKFLIKIYTQEVKSEGVKSRLLQNIHKVKSDRTEIKISTKKNRKSSPIGGYRDGYKH
jgi:hypothetical protein